ncbi:hypothetical protein M3Y96_00871700 [Aphelenchoides besseyi]|nr:hypothetical protein M3Y96_00871700 [Aphelenchoides besseyi]
MNAPYSAFLLLSIVFSIYLLSRYISYWWAMNSSSTDIDHNSFLGTNSTPIFVALIQRENSPKNNVKAARETWLRNVDNYVFTEQGATWYDGSRVRLPPSVRGDLLELRWIAGYVDAFLKENTANWFIVVSDTSYIVLENLIPLFSSISNDTLAYGLIESPAHDNFHLLVLNRPAMQFMAKALTLNLCATYDKNALDSCLKQLGHAERFNIDTDGNGRLRYFVQNRHMSYNEIKENTKNGRYSDGAPEFAIVGDYAHSFHNLHAKELHWFHIMIYGMKRAKL